MSLFDKDLITLAKRSNAEQLSSCDAFAQGFLMGRQFERERNADRYNRILSEMYHEEHKSFQGDTWWDKQIKELEEENFNLKSKYVWSQDSE